MSGGALSRSFSLSEFVESVAGEDRLRDSELSAFQRTLTYDYAAPPRDRPADPISRMFATDAGLRLVNKVGNETRSIGVLGMYAAELTVELVRLTPGADQALDRPDARQLAVFGRDHGTDCLLLVPEGRAPDAPVSIPASRLSHQGRLSAAFARVNERHQFDDPFREILLESGADGAADALWAVAPRVVVARVPAMELLGAPWPAFVVECGPDVSTAGAVALDSQGRTVITVSYHATGAAGTPIKIEGHDSVVADGSERLDTSYAVFPPKIPLPTRRGLSGPMTKRAPARGESATFYGGKSRLVTTFFEASDLGLPASDMGRMRCVQTKRDANPGDSGAALINDDDEIVGFCYRRSRYDENVQFADWVWARSVYEALSLQPY